MLIGSRSHAVLFQGIVRLLIFVNVIHCPTDLPIPSGHETRAHFPETADAAEIDAGDGRCSGRRVRRAVVLYG